MDQELKADIIRLETAADSAESPASGCRWNAARLYWEAIQAGDSQSEIAREIGKTQAHVRYMARCWDIFVVRPGIEFDGYETLGDFAAAYRSEEVRGADTQGSPRPEGAGRKRQRPRHKETTQEAANDIHSWSATVCFLAMVMARDTAAWDTLTEPELSALGEAEDAIHRVRTGR